VAEAFSSLWRREQADALGVAADRLTLLAGDYERMVADRLLFSTPPPFSLLIALCQDMQDRADGACRRASGVPHSR